MKQFYFLIFMLFMSSARCMESEGSSSDDVEKNKKQDRVKKEILDMGDSDTDSENEYKGKKLQVSSKKVKEKRKKIDSQKIDLSESSSFERLKNSPERAISQEDLNKLDLSDYDKLLELIKKGKKGVSPELHGEHLIEFLNLKTQNNNKLPKKAIKKLQELEKKDSSAYLKVCAMFLQLEKLKKESATPPSVKKKKNDEKRYSQTDVDMLMLRKEMEAVKKENEFLKLRIEYFSTVLEKTGDTDPKAAKYKALQEVGKAAVAAGAGLLAGAYGIPT